MARAMVKYGFNTLGFTQVMASTDAPNQHSIAVLEKLDMFREKQKNIEGKETIFYKIEKDYFERVKID